MLSEVASVLVQLSVVLVPLVIVMLLVPLAVVKLLIAADAAACLELPPQPEAITKNTVATRTMVAVQR
jgi:hypothetical protein